MLGTGLARKHDDFLGAHAFGVNVCQDLEARLLKFAQPEIRNLQTGALLRRYDDTRVFHHLDGFLDGGFIFLLGDHRCFSPPSDLGISLGAPQALWSAAACCRFPPRELARGNFDLEQNSPPASWLVQKRQQAAALQSASRTFIYSDGLNAHNNSAQR
jgi:hypothetical protein